MPGEIFPRYAAGNTLDRLRAGGSSLPEEILRRIAGISNGTDVFAVGPGRAANGNAAHRQSRGRGRRDAIPVRAARYVVGPHASERPGAPVHAVKSGRSRPRRALAAADLTTRPDADSARGRRRCAGGHSIPPAQPAQALSRRRVARDLAPAPPGSRPDAIGAQLRISAMGPEARTAPLERAKRKS